jgi:NitT/TauT family transport system permease protein
MVNAQPTAGTIAGTHRAGIGAPRVSRRKVIARTCTVLVGLLFLLGWQLASTGGLINQVFYSTPTDILLRLRDDFGGATVYGRTIYAQIWITVQAILIGYVIGVAGGVLLGFVVGRSRLLTRALERYILAFYAIPKISIAPLFILMFGIGLSSKIAIVIMESFFILFYNTLQGMISVKEELVQVAKVMGASRLVVARRVLLPACLPSIFNGLRLAVPFAVIGAVLGEYIASNKGIGWLVLYSGSSVDATGLFSAIVLLLVITWLMDLIVATIVRFAAPWLPRGRRSAARQT